MNYLTGLSTFVQTSLIQCCRGVLDNPVSPIEDPLGVPIAVPMRAEVPDPELTSPMVHVGVDLGPVSMPNNYGQVGTTADGQYLVMAAWAPGSAGIFTVYAPSDVLRRHLADWLAWGIMTGYAIDPDTNLRIDAYVLRVLRSGGIHPRLGELFAKPEFPAPNLAEGRPLGLPYRAIVRMSFDVQVGWTTQPWMPAAAQITVSPIDPPASVYPIVIPLPFTLPPPAQSTAA